MKHTLGIEADSIIENVPSLTQLLAELPDYAGLHEQIFLYDGNEGAREAASLLAEAGLLVERHELYQFTSGKIEDLFWDYGFQLGETMYIFKEMVEAFTLEAPSREAGDMARLQLSEHLVYTAHQADASTPVGFIDKELVELAIRISEAYGCQALFFNLDKQKKNL